MPTKVCDKGHDLVNMESVYEHGFTCDRCGAVDRVNKVWRCNSCEFDVCNSCYDPKSAGEARVQQRRASLLLNAAGVLDAAVVDATAPDATALDPVELDPTALDPTALDPKPNSDKKEVVDLWSSGEKGVFDLWSRAKLPSKLTAENLKGAEAAITQFLLLNGASFALLKAKLDNDTAGMDMDEFGKWLLAEQLLKATEEALLSMLDLRKMASELPHGIAGDPMAGARKLSRERWDELVLDMGKNAYEGLVKTTEAQAEQGVEALSNSKFAMDESEISASALGGIEDFEGSLQERIGIPHEDVREGIEQEHSRRADSMIPFTTPNYHITTTSINEYAVVTNREKAQAASQGGSGGGRRIKFFLDVLEQEEAKKASLTEAEVVALILFTGPMHYKYNAVLRKSPQNVVDSNRGNTYVNTISAIVSGIRKLSTVTPLPRDRIVFQGGSVPRLPKAFIGANERGICGGCEHGLLSTTTSFKTALQSSKDGLPTIFQIHVGAVNVCASLSFLSQYEGEEEVLFTPLSFIEVVGQVKLCLMEGVWVLVIPVAVSSNMQSDTVEGIKARRRQLHCTIAEFICQEVCRDLEDLKGSPQLLQRVQQDPSAKRAAGSPSALASGTDLQKELKRLGDSLITRCQADMRSLVEAQKQQPDAFFNADATFRQAMSELVDGKAAAVAKADLYLQDTALTIEHFKLMSLPKVRRLVLGRLRARMAKAARKEDAQGKKQAALQLCRETARTAADAEEVVQGETALMRASVRGDASGVQLLIEAGADARREVEDDTALMAAAESGSAASVQLILKAGADVNQKKHEEGFTALHLAAQGGHVQTVQTLIQSNADVHVAKENGGTPLMLAAQAGHVEIVRALINAKADVEAATKVYGFTALMLAAQTGRSETVRALIDAKADVKIVTNVGNFALNSAAQGRHQEIARALIEANADVNAAYQAAQGSHNQEVLDFLRGLGAGKP